MTQQITPTEHSKLVGGSTAARRVGCAASYVLEQRIPEQPSGASAREGTALHEMLARILIDDADPEDLLPFTHNQPAKGADPAWTFEVDHDLWYRLGEPALEMFDNFAAQMEAEAGAPFEFMVEKSMEYPGIPGAKGTSDVLWRCGTWAGTWDWKMGRRPVKAEGNRQLAFYMQAAVAAFPKFFSGVLRYRLSICQPQADSRNPSSWDVSPTELSAYDEELRTAIAGHTSRAARGEVGEATAGYWCDFARCAAICPLKLGATAKLGALLAKRDAVVDATPQGQVPDFDLAAFYQQALEIADDVEAWGKTVAAQAQEFIDNGGVIPGWKTVPKRSSGREWAMDEEKVKRRLVRLGLKAADYYNKKLISAPQAEGKLKKLKVELPADMWAPRPSSGTTLARDSDDRPAAKRPVDTTAALAAALNRRYGNTEN